MERGLYSGETRYHGSNKCLNLRNIISLSPNGLFTLDVNM